MRNLTILAFIVFTSASIKNSWSQGYEMNDSHFHLTNYIQEGVSPQHMLEIMGDRVNRVALFGIPLQQTWSYQNSGEYGPQYYLQSDAPLYYYSFTDAFIAASYLALDEEDQNRFDPMITGFNPADMYAVDHIKRVLLTFPGVFSGIGEFTIHKEFVSSKIAGNVASLSNPALDTILSFTAESGLLVIIHNDIDIPFQKEGVEPVYLTQMLALLERHSDATIIWAHTGLGRVVHPVRSNSSENLVERSPDHLSVIESILSDPKYDHVNFDISWDEVAKYVIASPDNTQRTADLINKYSDRFLFGTDNVAPENAEKYYAVYDMYQPLWDKLSQESKQNVLLDNYQRLFDAANEKVRKWEALNTVKQ